MSGPRRHNLRGLLRCAGRPESFVASYMDAPPALHPVRCPYTGTPAMKKSTFATISPVRTTPEPM